MHCDLLKSGAFRERPGEAIVEGAARLQQKTPTFWRSQYHGVITKNSSSAEWSLLGFRKQEGGAGQMTQAPWKSPEDREWIAGIGHEIIYTFGVWFCFALIATVPWFFPLEVGEYLVYFWFYRSPQLRDYEF